MFVDLLGIHEVIKTLKGDQCLEKHLIIIIMMMMTKTNEKNYSAKLKIILQNKLLDDFCAEVI